MAYSITPTNRSLSKQVGINPQVVLQIEGIETIFGSQPVLTFARWDSQDIEYDSGVRWDQVVADKNAIDVISLDSGTTTSISQQIYPDKASANSISSVNIKMVDLNNQVARLLSLNAIGEILGKKADFSIGFKQASFPENAIPVFRGIITDFYTENGAVNVTVSHPDSLKRQSIFEQYLSTLSADMDTITSIVGLDDWGEGLLLDQDALTSYIRINDEIMKVLVNFGTGVTVDRAQFGTVRAEHSIGDEVISQYRLTGKPLDLALKLMLSSEGNEYFLSDDKPSYILDNRLVFDYFNIQDLTGLVVGDLVEVDSVEYTIKSFSQLQDGSYIETNELIPDDPEFTGVFKYKSQYNVLPDGLGMLPFQVDVQGHLDIRNFNPSLFVDYAIDLKETVDEAKTFIEEQIYFPQGLYAIPRSARSSVKQVTPPLSSDILPTINTNNITNITNIKQRRSLHKYLYNIFRVDYELDEVDERYKRKEILINNDSRDRIKGGNKVLKIESQGFRDNPASVVAINNIIERFRDRYSFAPTYFEGINIRYSSGFNLEVGDVLPFGGLDTQIVNLETGRRDQTEKLFEVINKSLNIKTGEISIDLLETAFNIQARYAVVSLSSKLGSNNTATKIELVKSYDVGEYLFETDKWVDFEGFPIRVRSEDYTYDELTTLVRVDNQDNKFLIVEALPSAPLADYIIEIPQHDNSVPGYKLQFAHFTYKGVVASAASNSVFDVVDATNLVVGSNIVVSSPDFTDDSFGFNIEIIDITGNTVTVSQPLEFTPQAGYLVNNSNFTDGGFPYNII